MDDRRIEQALREGPPDEPAYIPGMTAATGDRTFLDRVEGRGVRGGPASGAPRPATGALRRLLPLAAVVTVAVIGLGIRSTFSPGASPSADTNDMLARIRADGVVHIAVSNETPQAETTGGAYIGFDVDVARAVWGWLGVLADVTFVSPAEILQGNGDWQLAFPSHSLKDDIPGAFVGPRYYGWPSWLVVASDSPVASIEGLSGAAICVVAGTSADAWLTGASLPTDTTSTIPAPLDATIVQRATDNDCLAALASGDAQAAVTATLLDVDFASRGLRPIPDSPVLREQRSLLIRNASALGDPTTLHAAVEAAIAHLRDTGQLGELSRRAFGGEDLTGDLP